MNLDSEAYWLQRISELDSLIDDLKHDKVDLKNEIHQLRNEIVKKNETIRELERQIVEFQKKEFHANEY